MATLTKSTGTVALSGAVEKVAFPAVYGWVWVKNMSDADMFVGLSDGVSAGADGVLTIPAGECGRVQTDGQDFVYLMGSGNALVVAQNYADCPFKVGGKGGDAPDLSAYAKKTDIPTALPADGGNADYAAIAHDAQLFNGKPYDHYVNYKGILQVDDLSAVPADVYEYLNDPTYAIPYEISTNATITELMGLPPRWWNIKYYPFGYNTGFSCQTAFPVGSDTDPFIRYSQDGVWSEWKEIYTSGNKPYITGSATVDANSTACASNHGFMPSAVLWWDGSTSGVAVSFNETQFVIEQASASARTVNYMIFK